VAASAPVAPTASGAAAPIALPSLAPLLGGLTSVPAPVAPAPTAVTAFTPGADRGPMGRLNPPSAESQAALAAAQAAQGAASAAAAMPAATALANNVTKAIPEPPRTGAAAPVGFASVPVVVSAATAPLPGTFTDAQRGPLGRLNPTASAAAEFAAAQAAAQANAMSWSTSAMAGGAAPAGVLMPGAAGADPRVMAAAQGMFRQWVADYQAKQQQAQQQQK